MGLRGSQSTLKIQGRSAVLMGPMMASSTLDGEAASQMTSRCVDTRSLFSSASKHVALRFAGTR